jgi:hypothetical protein
MSAAPYPMPVRLEPCIAPASPNPAAEALQETCIDPVVCPSPAAEVQEPCIGPVNPSPAAEALRKRFGTASYNPGLAL